MGEIEKARQVYLQASQKKLDQTSALTKHWIQFEKRHGTLAQVSQALYISQQMKSKFPSESLTSQQVVTASHETIEQKREASPEVEKKRPASQEEITSQEASPQRKKARTEKVKFDIEQFKVLEK